MSSYYFFYRDHAGGNEKIKQLVPGIRVFGGSIDNVKGCTDKLENGAKLSLGTDVNILSLHTPWYAFPILFFFDLHYACIFHHLWHPLLS